MTIDQFRVGQRVTHSYWPGCVLHVVCVYPDRVVARIVDPSDSSQLAQVQRRGLTDEFSAFGDMSLLLPSCITVPEGL